MLFLVVYVGLLLVCLVWLYEVEGLVFDLKDFLYDGVFLGVFCVVIICLGEGCDFCIKRVNVI